MLDDDNHVAADEGATEPVPRLVGEMLSFRVPHSIPDDGKVFVLGKDGKVFFVKLRDTAKQRPGEMYSVMTRGNPIPIVTQEDTSGLISFGITNDRGEVSLDAAEKLGDAFRQRLKSVDTHVLSHELSLAGQIIKLSFSSQLDSTSKIKTLKLYSFKHAKPFDIARIPYITSKDVKHEFHRKKIASEWIDLLPEGLADQSVAAVLGGNPTVYKQAVQTYHVKKCRLSANETATLQVFVGMNDKQLRRLQRSFKFFNLPTICASQKNMLNLKREVVDSQYKTLKFETIPLRRKVYIGKQKHMERDFPTLVTTVRPLEIQ